ncbi:MAG TPA: fumarylacetoacetate hydrolase family protein [Humibacter sp.]|jgi:2-keto-4-pentenoate hydratase/2-oxohepta-3-ene-1,7-dioic acid hydratase in catechol pathway|nr:fumarylacetoacetate hydrolase family protein [Humibacter sp.]
MRLVTFRRQTESGVEQRAGVQLDDFVVDLERAGEAAPGERLTHDLLTFVAGGDAAIHAARTAVDFVLTAGAEEVGGRPIRFANDQIQLCSPLPRPNSLRDYMVVEEHMANAVAKGMLPSVPEEWFNIPAYYKGNVDEIYGPDDTIPWPSYTDKLDYELEVCAVIGTPGRNLSAAAAPRHIIGYTLYNDWSARDIQKREMSIGIGAGVSKDFGSSIGPCIATPDEFERDIAPLQARIDGEVWSSGVLGKMRFSFEEIIEWTSRDQTMRPGDLLGSGTIGKGCGVELDRWLTPGCTVELEAEGIGILRNTVSQKGAGPRRATPPAQS